MRLLVLGGSAFLSREVARQAVERGHRVTCACRGTSGPLPDGVRHVAWDRDQPPPPDLGQDHDAVIDVARHPSRVRAAVAALPEAHWVFVSTISVYADSSVPGGTPDTLPLLDPVTTDEDPMSSPETYGAMKVACEQAVAAGAASSLIARPGLIVGPGDPSGRFSYWPERIADGGEVLAPGSPDDAVQVVDVRDLAAWLVDGAERRRTGTLDAVGPVGSRGAVLDAIATGVGVPLRATWVPQEFLLEQQVEPWMGPRSLPLWLPLPEHAGLMAHDASPARAAGLTTRPVEETARDTLAWLRATPEPPRTGLTRRDEAALLAAWHSLRQ
ncbi:NAD-dependent epimerase/dehydratase family protein [Nocardioides donggukensis]|uniref:NAD-dependent epimerase/dehydratase family protein n=1 Tax=Nocardioides donggukensis TaxID=2774019 RepID=A0A927K2C9_9ACTN|nr:NAD-dependent epimerase/dehydratase family protein [Nocardioides donggukensis]MBD8868173.1 NAD-dependent epimerase/dehydratase family protein [Nocardioides donggukensis]